MKHRRVMIALLLVVPLTAAPTAHAETETVAPPFDSAEQWADCGTDLWLSFVRIPTDGTCSADADATAAGSLSGAISLETGSLPISSASGDTYAVLELVDELEDATIVSYTVTYEVSGAEYRVDPPSVADDGYGEFYLYGSANTIEDDAGASFGHTLASNWDDAVSDGIYTRRLLLVAPGDQPLSGGVQIQVSLRGYANISQSPSATVSTGADVQIVSVTSKVIE